MTLSTHVLDLERGLPAPGVPVRVERLAAEGWRLVAEAVTDADGRVRDAVPVERWTAGRWRLVLTTGDVHGPDALYPEVVLTVTIAAGPDGIPPHHHLPVLLSRHGYTTYRGS